jgi:sec1 family domain-containing protein 1
MLREMQKQRIRSFLQAPESPWKVLVLDERTQRIVSPLMKVNELRECGITTHFLATQTRQPIENTPAVYFVQRSTRIAEDVGRELYSGYYLNYVTSMSRKEMEELAFSVSQKRLGLRIRSIYDQFLDFVALQDDLFSLEQRNSFIEIEDGERWKEIVMSLLSVAVTLGEAPVIVTREDRTCTEIAKLLESKIRNTRLLKKTTKRPVLILVNRNYDVLTPVQHVWSYNALMNDLLHLSLNKVTTENKKSFDLDPSDVLWTKNGNEYFPSVVETVEKELLEYKKEMALRSVDERSDKRAMQEVLEKAPELARRHESVNAHIAICSEIVEIIKRRGIDDFYKIEKGGYTSQELLDVSEKGTDDDILRLAISLLNTKDADLVDAVLQKRKVRSRALEFFRGHQSLSPEKPGTFYSQVVTGLMGNVKKLMPVKEQTPLSILVESIYGSIKSQSFPGLRRFDPLKADTVYASEVSRIVVFVVGGGTYTEMKTLKLLEEKIKVPIVYGSTEMLNAEGFIKQVEEMMKNDNK